MKDLLGSPGTVCGLMLRIGQCLFAAASIGVMVSAAGFSSFTTYCYLIASMGLHVLWSFGLACLDIYALRVKRDLRNPVLVSLFVVGDWAGYRHIDCAQRYGNETEIGDTLKKLFEDGVVKRDDLWITSKLWCSDHAKEDVPLALNRTLNDLQLDYVDLYLMHWPVSMKKGSVGFEPENLTKADIPSTWRAMESLCDAGKAKAIGVSNFSSKKLADLLDVARIPPAVNQVECHPSWQQPQLHSFCEARGVHISGYSPLGSSGNLGSNVLKNPILNLVAEKLGKTPAQVALRWGLQMGHSVLPKSTNEKRINENFDVFDWCIPEDLCAKFSEIEQVKLISGNTFVHETLGHYKTIEELWDGEI